MAKGGRLELSLQFEGARPKTPTKGLQVLVLDSSYRRRATIRLGADMLRSGALAPGRYHLSITGRSIATQTIPFVVESGRDAKLRVVIAAGQRCVFHKLKVMTESRVGNMNANDP